MKVLSVFCLLATTLSVSISADALFEEHILYQNLGGAISINGTDLNGDGFIDIIYCSFLNSHIKWLENDGSQNFTFHTIVEGFTNPRAVDTEDIDGNGTTDIVASGRNKISWFSNDGAGNFTEYVISTDWYIVNGVQLTDAFTDSIIDINSDGKVDILATSCTSGVMGWFENDGSGNFTEHIVKDNWTLVSEASAADIDSDGDQDIFAAAQASGIWWFENDGSENFTEHLIFNGWVKPNRIQAGDIDGDGDIDFAAGSCGTNAVIGWFENDGSENFTCHPLRTGFGGPRTPIVKDIDNDGDVDIIATAWSSSITVYFENDGNQNFSQYVISTNAYDLLDIAVADLDSDGDKDLLGGSAEAAANHIRWWESIDTFVVAEFTSDLYSGHAPLTVQFSDMTRAKPAVNYWAWDFNSDGTIDSYDENPLWTYNSPGVYSVTLISSNSQISDTCVEDSLISVFDGESALRFFTVYSSAICPCSPEINITDSLTVEAWVYPVSWGSNASLGYGTILDKTNFSLVLFKNVYGRNCLALKLKHEGGVNSLAVTPDSSIHLNGWQHVAATYSYADSSVRIFINGVEQSLTFNPSPSGKIADNESLNLSIGLNQVNNFRFDGIIDEVRLWNIVRTPQEIQNSMGACLSGGEQGLAGYWKMNEANGDTLFDNSPNSDHFSLVGTKWVQGTPFYPTGVEETVFPAFPAEVVSDFNCRWINGFVFNFDFKLSADKDVSVSLYDVLGREVREISNGRLERGVHELSLNMSPHPAGQYFLVINTNNIIFSKKIALFR